MRGGGPLWITFLVIETVIYFYVVGLSRTYLSGKLVHGPLTRRWIGALAWLPALINLLGFIDRDPQNHQQIGIMLIVTALIAIVYTITALVFLRRSSSKVQFTNS